MTQEGQLEIPAWSSKERVKLHIRIPLTIFGDLLMQDEDEAAWVQHLEWEQGLGLSFGVPSIPQGM